MGVLTRVNRMSYEIIAAFAYIGYVSIGCVVAYPLFRWKRLEPKTAKEIFGMFAVNLLLFGMLPVLPLFMRKPPENRSDMGPSEAEDYRRYFEDGKIWFWQGMKRE